MDPEYWRQIRSLFDAASEVGPEEREALLAAAPAEVGGVVRSMLAEMDGPPATLLAGRFRLLRPLGAGGMADVFAAHDEQLDTEVAVKILRGAGGAPATLARFRREIALARQIGHENVCRIFDLHFHESTPLLSMELLDGPTLAERLASGGAFSPEGALPILRAIAAALDAAHRRCIVHRDLKPGNVILVADRAVVTDFGLAGETPAGPGDSGAESLIGTPLYMAPEQFRNAAPTPAMDIYSLGALAFEMVAGHPVFPSDTPARLALEKNNPHPAFPGSLDPAWQKAIRRALSPDPAERQPTATAFVDALAILRDSRRGVLAAGVATVAIGSAWWLMRPQTARPAEAERLLGIATKAMLAGAHWRAVRSLEQAVAMAPWDGELIARLAWAWLMHDQADRTRALLPGAAPGAVRDCVTALLRLDEAGAMEALRDLPDERAILLADLGPPVLPIQRQEANNMSRYPYRAAALARTVREVPEFQAALTHVGRDNDEFVHPLQLDLIRTMLPAPDAPGVDNQLRAAMETARREANPELLCRRCCFCWPGMTPVAVNGCSALLTGGRSFRFRTWWQGRWPRLRRAAFALADLSMPTPISSSRPRRPTGATPTGRQRFPGRGWPLSGSGRGVAGPAPTSFPWRGRRTCWPGIRACFASFGVGLGARPWRPASRALRSARSSPRLRRFRRR
jgi:hypothetical protein